MEAPCPCGRGWSSILPVAREGDSLLPTLSLGPAPAFEGCGIGDGPACERPGAKPEASISLRMGKPGGLTLCVLRCLPPLATPPGATGRGETIPGTERDGRCPHPDPPPPVPAVAPSPGPLKPHGDDAGEFVSGKSDGRGIVAPGAGPGEPFEIEVDRGRPRIGGLTSDEVMEGVEMGREEMDSLVEGTDGSTSIVLSPAEAGTLGSAGDER